jgi:hypothetical protein
VLAQWHQRCGDLGGDSARDQDRPAERPAQPSSRLTRLTAGPMAVKSSRSTAPMLPHRISPRCRAAPKGSGGNSCACGGEYLELTPHERIRFTDRFDDPNLPGEIRVTVTLKKVSCGTEMNIVQKGVPTVIPAEACYLGWQDSLTLLAKLVEPESPE